MATKLNKKEIKDLISLVANAVDSSTIPEAEDYLVEKYNNLDDEFIQHAFLVLDTIYNKQSELIK